MRITAAAATLLCFLCLLVPTQAQTLMHCAKSVDSKYSFKDLINLVQSSGRPGRLPASFANILGVGNGDVDKISFEAGNGTYKVQIDFVQGKFYVLSKEERDDLLSWRLSTSGELERTVRFMKGTTGEVKANQLFANELKKVCEDLLAIEFTYRGSDPNEKGEYHRAIQDVELAMELDPSNPWSYYFRGVAREKSVI